MGDKRKPWKPTSTKSAGPADKQKAKASAKSAELPAKENIALPTRDKKPLNEPESDEQRDCLDQASRLAQAVISFFEGPPDQAHPPTTEQLLELAKHLKGLLQDD